MGVVTKEFLKSKQLTISQINSKAHNTGKTKLLTQQKRKYVFGMLPVTLGVCISLPQSYREHTLGMEYILPFFAV